MTPTFVIEWTGPYTDPEETDQKNILYLITGSSKTGMRSEKIRYVGKTSSNCKGRFTDSHKYKTHIGNDGKFWIGKIKNSNSAKNNSSAISKAEKILVHYLKNYSTSSKVDLLNKKLINEPIFSIGVINRWYDKNKEEYCKRIFPSILIPDGIIWDKSNGILFSSMRMEKNQIFE